MLLDSPEKPAAESRSRLSAFAFDEERAAGSPPPALVIAESGPDAESSASKAAEPASRCPTPHLPPVEEQELDSPRSPSPSATSCELVCAGVQLCVQCAPCELLVANTDAVPGVRR